MIRAIDAYQGGDAVNPPATVASPVAASPGFGNPAAAGAVAAPGLPTGNTWAASHADIPKNSSAPYLIAGLAVLLLGGGAFAAYQKFGGKPDGKADVAAAASARPAEPVAPREPTAPPSSAPVVVPAAAAPEAPAATKPAESAKPAASAPTAKSQPPAAVAQPVRPAFAKPAAAKPAIAVAPAKPAGAKPARDFGY